MRSFEEWHPHLISTAQPIRVITDHKNLQYFATKRQLNQRQVRWSWFMAQFPWYAEYRPGKLGVKPDSLTRRSGNLPKVGDEHLVQHMQILLKRENYQAERHAESHAESHAKGHADSHAESHAKNHAKNHWHISKTGIYPLDPPRDPWSFGVINDRMHSVECSGASKSSHTYIEITWDTPVIYMIILKVTGKLLLPMYSDLVAPEAYTYPNGFSVSLSAFLPDNTGVATLILITAMRPCHIHQLHLVPPSMPPEYPLLEVLFLVIHPIVTFV